MQSEIIVKSLKDDNYTEIEAILKEELETITKLYKRGLYTEKEYWRFFSEQLWHIEWHVVLPESMGIRLNYDTYSNWLRMREERELFDSGRIPAGTVGEPWLVLCEDGKTDAPPEMKIKIFKLMDIFHLPIFSWEKPEPSIKEYKKIVDRLCSTGIKWKISSWLKDDGGLTTDDSPEGKTFRLVDEADCEYYIKIEGVDNGKYGWRYYEGVGHITSYTSNIDRELSISIWKGNRIFCFYYTFNREDIDKTCSPFEDEKWKPYFAWLNGKQTKEDAYLKEYMNSIDRAICEEKSQELSER